jgi:aminoglycoside phosphotransferase
VPQVVAFEHDVDDATAWLVTSPLAGEPGSAVHHRVDGRGLARAFAAGLRAVHDLDVASCPFDAGLEARTGIVVERIEQGAVVSAQLSEAYRRHEPDRLLALWRGARPPDEDLVVTHGRYTLDGVSIAHGEVAGYRDWYRCGVADRYVDLAVAAGSLAAAVGPELVVEFFDAYGIEHPSLAKIDFYALGAELLG